MPSHTITREAVLKAAKIIGDHEQMLPEGRLSRGRRVTTRRFESAAEADRHDLEFCQQIPAADRLLYVWQLSLEQWQLAGGSPHEPGLCRSVASLHRR